MEEYFVYALVSKIDRRIYVGISENPEKRLIEHNSGKTKSTKGFIPWELFFKRAFKTRIEAREYEKYYKSGSGKEKLKLLLAP
jgi:putative endonuclease